MSWVTLLLVVVVAGAAYLGSVWAPVYFDHYTVKQVVADYMNQAIKNKDDAQLVARMVAKIRGLSTVVGVDQYGQPTRTPAIPLEEAAVTWQRDDGAKTLHIAFEYERQVVYPYLNRTAVKTFSLDRTFDITVPDWGPAR